MNLKLENNELEHKKKNPNSDSTIQKSEVSLPEPPKDYENMVQKLEAEVRNHIGVEQQLKLHIETMQSKIEELESKNTNLSDEIKKSQKLLKEKQEIIETQQKELVIANNEILKLKKLSNSIRTTESLKSAKKQVSLKNSNSEAKIRPPSSVTSSSKSTSKTRLYTDKSKEIIELKKQLNVLHAEIAVTKAEQKMKGKTLTERSQSISGMGTLINQPLKTQKKSVSGIKNTAEQLRFVLAKKSSRSSSEIKKRPPSLKMRPSTTMTEHKVKNNINNMKKTTITGK